MLKLNLKVRARAVFLRWVARRLAQAQDNLDFRRVEAEVNLARQVSCRRASNRLSASGRRTRPVRPLGPRPLP